MGLKVAIVGMSPSCRDAPWGDPAWEKWGLPWHDGYWPKYDRLFEMHDKRLLESAHSKRPDGYMARLAESLVFTQDNYPFAEVAETIGAAYWNSSIAYALALAIHEGAEEIAIFGVDMKGDDEYGYQKPNMEYLIGLARGKGIAVHIPQDSPLCKFQPAGIRFYEHNPIYIDRYGWLG